MNTTLNLFSIAMILGLIMFLACGEDDGIGDSIIDTTTTELSELDSWIYTNLTDPYNIQVEYLYDDNQVDASDYITPAKEEEVQPFLEAYLSLFIDAFNDNVSEEFVKLYSAKLLILVGGYCYNSDGTRYLGQAEGGVKVTLYEINYFTERISDADVDSDSREYFKRYFHTIEHEFGHILQQNKAYDIEAYSAITPGYRSDWTNLDDEEALNEGFITPYASSDVNEDWVEMVATLLTNTEEEFEAILDSPDNDEAKEAFQEKMEIIVAYYEDSWGIDLYALRDDIAARTDEYIENFN